MRLPVQAYQSVKPRILDIMAEIVGECVNDFEKRSGPLKKVGDQISGKADEERWRIFVTGHSMGGSKATLCAYELAVRLGSHPNAQTYSDPLKWRLALHVSTSKHPM